MKPLLVGEQNPYQTDPRLAQRYALYPDPPRCAGWNLCHRIMQLDEGEYLRRFDRVNLCDGKWSMKEARKRASELAVERLGTRTSIVLFGRKVTDAFNFDDAWHPFRTWSMNLEGSPAPTYVILPHPSGLSRAWNEPGAFERARAVLREAGVI